MHFRAVSSNPPAATARRAAIRPTAHRPPLAEKPEFGAIAGNAVDKHMTITSLQNSMLHRQSRTNVLTNESSNRSSMA